MIEMFTYLVNKRVYWILYPVYAILSIIILNSSSLEYFDTRTYFDAFFSLAEGKLDWVRTPLYPFFVGTIRWLLPTHYLLAICVIQCLIFGFTIRLFYRTIFMLTDSGWVSFVVAMVYVLSPTTSDWIGFVLTESLSISMITALVYLMVKMWQKGISYIDIYLTLLLSLLMIFIRPSFIYIALCITIMSICLYRKWKAMARSLILMSVLPAIVLALYCSVYSHTYGIYTPSAVVVINKGKILAAQQSYMPLPQQSHLPLSYIEDNTLRYDMERAIVLAGNGPDFEGFNAIRDKYGIKTISWAFDEYGKNYPKDYLIRTFKRLQEFIFVNSYRFTKSADCLHILSIHPLISIAITFMFMVLTYIIFIKNYRQRNNNDNVMLYVVLLLMVIINYFITWIGADTDYYRLLATSAPITLLFIAVIFVNLYNFLSKHFSLIK